MSKTSRRVFGDRIECKSLNCAPVNELGVVYLFGVLHEAFDFNIESVQAGFPDCIARKKIGENRWEEVRIEFEFESKSFYKHRHDPNLVDVIVCWLHNWPECPEHIEIIELRSLVGDIEQIDSGIRNNSKLNVWHLFCQEKRKEGLSFSEIARLYKKNKQ